MKKLSSVVALLLLCSVCAIARSSAPDWVNGISAQYPADKYLIGVGIADSLDGARGNARAEVAKVFKAQVSQLAKETQSERTVQSGKKSANSSSVEASVNTQVMTDMQLEGVEITETWLDPKNASQYALAVLDKQKLRMALAGQIAEQEQTVEAQLKAAKETVSAIEQVRDYAAALKALDKKNALAAEKRVVDPVAVADVDAVSRTEIQQRQRLALNKLKFIIEAAQPGAKELIGSKISALGFKVQEAVPASGPDTLLLIRAQSSLEPLERNNPDWKFYTYQCSVQLLDYFNNEKILASDSKEGQVSQLTDEAVKQKAQSISKQEAASIAEVLVKNYLFGE